MGISTTKHSTSMHSVTRVEGSPLHGRLSAPVGSVSNSPLAACAKHVGYLALLGILLLPQASLASNSPVPLSPKITSVTGTNVTGSTATVAQGDTVSFNQFHTVNSWTSSNHENSSVSKKSWQLYCREGSTISFDYSVSSESNCDWLTISLNDNQLVRVSGQVSESFSYKVEKAGNYTLTAQYSKDGSQNSYDDCGIISNIMVSPINDMVEAFLEDLTPYPGMKQELETVIKAVNANPNDSVAQAQLQNTYWSINKALEIYPIIQSDLVIADSVLTDGAYVDIAEAVKLGKAIDVNTSKSADYWNAYDALETSLAVQHSSQVAMENWAFDTNNVYTIDELRYYLDDTNGLAKFAGFNQSTDITTLVIPSTVRKDGKTYAVVGIESGNYHNGYYNSYRQEKLVSISLPKTIRYIANYAFSYFPNMQYLEIPENVTTMGNNIFEGSDNLKTLKMNAVVPPMVGSFSGTDKRKVYVPDGSLHAYRLASPWNNCVLVGGEGTFVSIDHVAAGELGHFILDKATYLQEVNKLTVVSGNLNNDDWNTLKSMTNLVELDISGMAVTSIPSSAFENKWGLEKIVLPKKLETIGYAAFRGTGLKEIELPENLTTLDSYAFQSCSSLANVKMSGKVTGISGYCFQECRNLQKVELAEGLQVIHNGAFYLCNSLQSINFPSTLTLIDYDSFNGTDLREIDIPASVENINYRAFCDNKNLKKVTFREGLINIGASTFSGCESIDSIVCPSTLRMIDNSGFQDCKSLKKVQLNEGLVSINANAFRNCSNLTDIVLPSTLENCKGNAFRECGNIKTIEARSVLPPTTDGSCPLSNVDLTGVTLYVPSWSVGEYQLADGWNSFYTFQASNYLPQSIKVNKDFYFSLGDNDNKEYRPNISMTWSDHEVRDANGNLNYERGNLTVSSRSKLAINDFDMIFSPYAKYYLDENIRYNNQVNDYRTKYNGTSLIVKGEMRAENVTLNLYNFRGRWQFVTFPFDVKVSDIVPESENTSWVIRGHSGAMRAAGKNDSVWVNLKADDVLEAGKGYIMHCYNPNNDVDYTASELVKFRISPLTTTVNRQLLFASGDRTLPLEENLSEFEHNRSWNLIGNPYPSFYDTRFMEFDAPFMVWNSYTQNYYAYNPADDAYILSPGEALFVQRPVDQKDITFLKDGRQINQYARTLIDETTQARARGKEGVQRSVFNLTLSGENTSDRTRVVLNDEASMAYEMNKDAAKFASTVPTVAQIYSWNGESRYAINERPTGSGIVNLGVHCGTKGTYTIALANAVDGQVILEDKLMNISTEITADKGYSFEAEAGDDDSRFVLHITRGIGGGDDTTGINGITTETGEKQEVYSLDGIKMNAAKKGVYIQNGKKIIKK